jgi:hypothetical protein
MFLDVSQQVINEDKKTEHSRERVKVRAILADREFFFRRGAVVGKIQSNKPDHDVQNVVSQDHP